KGMAKTLLSELIAIAKIRGLTQLIACVRRDNAPMLKVFENAGFLRANSQGYDEVSLAYTL
ncbi:MAG: L-amino acid N-acyltransferase YncA, partial [Colwellia sp.]